MLFLPRIQANRSVEFYPAALMKYYLSFPDPHTHHIRIRLEMPASGEKAQKVFLSKWRPGRYEIAPYIENIIDVKAQTASGKDLAVHKIEAHGWEIAASADEEIHLHYAYHANFLDAGGSYFGEEQVYINGVNLFLFQEERIDEEHRFWMDLPKGWITACGLKQDGDAFVAKDLHQLLDAPLISSPTLQEISYEVGGIPFHIWLQGDVSPDIDKVRDDFKLFSVSQMQLFGDFPAREYHFLFQIHNKHYYHGVEHYNSTVISIGPGFRFMKPALYEDVLGVSCHELFHTWNVKAIRPADMWPYDYRKENYSRLHYVTEGVTTYYGDLMLLKSGVWGLKEYLKVFNDSNLKRVYANNGKDHISLELSSFDSWITGYKKGVPNRKISFYTKGALVALIFDVAIRKATGNERSLDDVLRLLWERYGKAGKGYTREGYKALLEEVSGIDFTEHFDKYISGTSDLKAALKDAATYLGLTLKPMQSSLYAVNAWGFELESDGQTSKVKQVFENSPAFAAGLAVGDEIVAINGIKASAPDVNDLMRHFGNEEECRIHIFRHQRLKKIKVHRDTDWSQELWYLFVDENASAEAVGNREAWERLAPRFLAKG